jgi:hypothetical protein
MASSGEAQFPCLMKPIPFARGAATMEVKNDRKPARTPYPRGASLFAVAWIVLVLIATLTPGDTAVPPFTACIICGSQGIADAICNIVLFLPVGAALMVLGARPARAVLLAAALSAFVEGMQATIVAGRDPSLGDVVFNSIGGILGVLALRTAHVWLAPTVRNSRLLAGTAVLAACAAVAATGLLLQPAFERTLWYGQWTANFGNMERYDGEVLDAQIGGRLVPSRRLDDGGAARQALLDGRPLLVRVRSSPLTRRISAVFSVYDDRRSEQFLLGANGSALDLYVRRRANDVRLVNPPLRFEGALSGVSGGDTLTLEVRREGVIWCAGRVPHVPCLGYTAGAGWGLLQDIGFLRQRALLMDALWLFGLLAPAGYWLRGLGGMLGGLAATLLACAFVPMVAGLVVSPATEWVGAVAGLASGHALGALVRRRMDTRP